MIKKLDKSDIWALIVGAAALATGGGGAAPSYDVFCERTDPGPHGRRVAHDSVVGTHAAAEGTERRWRSGSGGPIDPG